MKRGYIKKEKDVLDARVYRFSLTEQGKNLRVIFDEISDCLLEEIYKNFPSNEKRQIIELLQKIRNDRKYKEKERFHDSV